MGPGSILPRNRHRHQRHLGFGVHDQRTNHNDVQEAWPSLYGKRLTIVVVVTGAVLINISNSAFETLDLGYTCTVKKE